MKNGGVARQDESGTVTEVRSRVRDEFEDNIDRSSVQVIDQSDRFAQNLGESDIDWLTYSGGEEEE